MRGAVAPRVGVETVDVDVVEEPPWTPERMSPAARRWRLVRGCGTRMARWLAPALGVLVLAAAAGVGTIVWSQGSDTAACDRAMLSAVLNDGIVRAEQAGQAQFEVVRPPGCGEDDLADVLPEVTRSWHMMPGGVMMREAAHPGS